MKNLVILSFILAPFFISAQHLKESKVPAPVLNSFKKEFPKLVVKQWEKEGDNYEAEVEINGMDQSFLYDATGNFIAKEEMIGASEVPTAVMDYLVKNFPGMVAQEFTRVVKADGTASYEADINNQDLIFDSSGNFKGNEKENESKDKD